MIRLAHISDLHLGPLPPVAPRDVLTKRITGYLDWRFSRNRRKREAVLNGLAAHIATRQPDLIAISGDLVNLGTKPNSRQSPPGWLGSDRPNGWPWCRAITTPSFPVRSNWPGRRSGPICKARPSALRLFPSSGRSAMSP